MPPPGSRIWHQPTLFLMPNLMALGAPVMLIGTEQENGTLDWLRSLPLHWRDVFVSKVVTALAATLLIWGLASLTLWMTVGWTLGRDPFSEDIRSVGGVLIFLHFSVTLLACGLITSFLFRSPVASLIAVVPFVTVVSLSFNETGRWLAGGGSWGRTYPGVGNERLDDPL